MTAEGLIKFPRTAHLFWLGEGAPRGDRLLAPAAARRLMSRPVAVEEKIDGSNLGLSVGANGRLRAQSRGRYLKAGTGGQYQPLWRWLALAEERLQAALGTSLLAFGEWCYARHTMAMTRCRTGSCCSTSTSGRRSGSGRGSAVMPGHAVWVLPSLRFWPPAFSIGSA